MLYLTRKSIVSEGADRQTKDMQPITLILQNWGTPQQNTATAALMMLNQQLVLVLYGAYDADGACMQLSSERWKLWWAKTPNQAPSFRPRSITSITTRTLCLHEKQIWSCMLARLLRWRLKKRYVLTCLTDTTKKVDTSIYIQTTLVSSMFSSQDTCTCTGSCLVRVLGLCVSCTYVCWIQQMKNCYT